MSNTRTYLVCTNNDQNDWKASLFVCSSPPFFFLIFSRHAKWFKSNLIGIPLFTTDGIRTSNNMSKEMTVQIETFFEKIIARKIDPDHIYKPDGAWVLVKPSM